ncbi:hypothetical protein HK101_010168 [Irineochytrium annulatum]|nr:hypothetical protein HK101_010168 [Irineochytrium annulatum]
MFNYFFGSKFTPEQLPDLTGKVAVITGASSGLGKESTLALAKKGARVVMACRSVSKAEGVAEEIRKTATGAKLDVMELDLSSLASVRKFAEEYKRRRLPIHILLNNAGGIQDKYTETKDGIETQFGQNHVGHFYLTALLLPILEDTAKSGPVTIVNVSSMAHSFEKGLNLDKINDEKSYTAMGAYGRSKLANILFSVELQRRLEAKGQHNIFVNSIHPGGVATDFFRAESVGGWSPYLRTAVGLFFATPAQGAYTQVYASASPEIVEKNLKARYFVPTAALAEPSATAKDAELARKLWDWTDAKLKEKGFSY